MQADNGKLRYGIELDYDKLRSDAAEAENILNGIGRTAVENGSQMDDMMKKVGKGIAAYFTVDAFAKLAKEIVNVRGEIQSLEVSFNTLTGSAEVGGKLLGEIREFAVSTPMQMDDLAKGAQTLLSFNIAAEEVMPILKSLGDVSMGDSQKFQSLTLAFSQMSSTGKLMGQDLLQMINAGFNPLSVISEQTGKSIGELKDEMAKGAISAEMVKQAFMDATAEGGKFHGMLEAQSHTINGAMSNLQGAVQDMFNSIGEASEGVIVDAVTGVTKLVQNYEKVGAVLMDIVAAYGAYKAAVMATNAVQNVKTTTSHIAEIESLNALLTAEQKEMLAKSELSVTDEAYYEEVKKCVAVNLEEAKSALSRARVEVSAAAQVMQKKREEYVVAKQLAAQKKEELAAAVASGEEKKIEAAETAYNTAEQERLSAARVFQTAAMEKNAKQTAVESAAKKLNSATTAANTAQQTANATATGILGAAKLKLISIMNKLKAALMSNPYAAIAAAVAALVVGIYKLATAETEAEKAARELNETVERGKQEIQAEVTVLDQMFDALKKAKEGTVAYDEARQAIMEKYGSYLDNLGLELNSLQDIETAHYKVRDAIIEEARAKLKTEALQTAAKSRAESEAAGAERIRHWLTDANASEYIQPMIEAAKNGQRYTYNSMIPSNISTIGMARLMGAYDLIHDAKAEYEREVGKINQIYDPFLNELKKTVETTVPSTTEKTIKELRADFEKAADATKKKALDKEIKAKEATLSIIKDVNEQIKWLKEQQDATSAGSTDYKDYANRIKALEAKLPKTDSKSSSVSNDAERLKERQQQLDQDISSYYEGVGMAIREGELELRQSQIDLMDDGVDRTLAQYKLNYDKQELAIEKLEKQYIDDLLELRHKEWQRANPKAKESEWETVRPTLTVGDLSDDQKEQLSLRRSLNREAYEQSTGAILKDLLRDYETYEQQRNAIVKKYSDERAQLYEEDGKTLKAGVSQGNVDELDRSEADALKNIDEQFAQREVSYRQWMDTIADFTLDQLTQVLEAAKAKLQELEKSGNASDTDLAVARAKVNSARNAIDNIRSKKAESPSATAVKEWNQLYSALQNVNSEFGAIADSVEELDEGIGKLIVSISQDLLTAVDGIATLMRDAAGNAQETGTDIVEAVGNVANGTINAMQSAASGAATAIKAVEKASVILAIIGALLSIIQKIRQQMEDANQEEINRIEEEIDSVYYRIQNRNIELFKQQSEGVDALLASWVHVTRYQSNWLNDLFKLTGKVAHVRTSTDEMRIAIENTAQALSDMGYTADKVCGSMKYDVRDTVDAYLEAAALLVQENANLNTNKKKDRAQMEANNQAYYENLYAAYNAINEAFEDIMGATVENMASKLGDAFVSAFQDGTDAAKAWGDAVDDIVRDIAKNMIITQVIEDSVGHIYDTYKARWFSSGGVFNDDAFFSSLDDLQDDLVNIYDDTNHLFQRLLDEYPSLAEMLGIGADGRDAVAKGIATASQESIDELNGRMTAVQGHTYTINENTKLLVQNTNAILQGVLAIEGNTARLANVENDIASVRHDINEMATFGITLR